MTFLVETPQPLLGGRGGEGRAREYMDGEGWGNAVTCCGGGGTGGGGEGRRGGCIRTIGENAGRFSFGLVAFVFVSSEAAVVASIFRILRTDLRRVGYVA